MDLYDFMKFSKHSRRKIWNYSFYEWAEVWLNLYYSSSQGIRSEVTYLVFLLGQDEVGHAAER